MTSKRHIIPILGKYKLVNLRPEQIQFLYNTKLKSGTGVRTIEVIHTVIHRSLNHAVKLGVLSRNPSDAVSKPRTINNEMRIFSENEVNQFLNLSQGTRYETLYHIAIATGLRQSELLAIKWSDLDWEKRTLNVQRQLKRKHIPGDYYDSPKTTNGRRSITLGQKTIQKLREQLKRQEKERDTAGIRWKENDLIFP
jgi:integrase